jgi:hypothetical protein
MRIRYLLGLGFGLASSLALTGDARACSSAGVGTPVAFPGAGATDVSPQSSIFLVTPTVTTPTLVLEENGVALPSSPVSLLGQGQLGYQYGTFWRLSPQASPSSPLLPASRYVLKIQLGSATSPLSQFTTAASYDKQPGQAAVLTALRLWRVHYSAEEIGGGSCVFSEYMGYVDLDYQDSSVPNTPAAEVVNVIRLVSRQSLDEHSFVVAGNHFEGIMEGPGGVPHAGTWTPPLMPGEEYCATMTSYGRNDLAMPVVVSDPICAKVQNVDTNSPDGCSVPGRPGALASAWLALLGLLLVRRRRR